MAFIRRPVQSSAISAIDYDDETQELGVTFRQGGPRYSFPNVPQDEFEAFAGSDSPGRYFLSNIKGNY
jgi:hypothetical protein